MKLRSLRKSLRKSLWKFHDKSRLTIGDFQIGNMPRRRLEDVDGSGILWITFALAATLRVTKLLEVTQKSWVKIRLDLGSEGKPLLFRTASDGKIIKTNLSKNAGTSDDRSGRRAFLKNSKNKISKNQKWMHFNDRSTGDESDTLLFGRCICLVSLLRISAGHLCLVSAGSS